MKLLHCPLLEYIHIFVGVISRIFAPKKIVLISLSFRHMRFVTLLLLLLKYLREFSPVFIVWDSHRRIRIHRLLEVVR